MKKSKWRFMLTAVVALVMMISFPMPSARASTFYNTFISSCEGESWFISYVNAQLLQNGKRLTELTSADDEALLNIKELVVPQSGIATIPSAVRFLKNLETIELQYNKITDITPLYGCVNIKVLNLEGNRIENIDLSVFPKLEELNLSFTGLNVMPEFTGNPLIKRIYLRGNNIKAVTSIEGVDSLSYIDLAGNRLQSLDIIGAFTMSNDEVSTLDISYNNISDIGFTKNISGLKSLNAAYNVISNGISDIPPSLERLDISHNGIKEGQGLSGIIGIKYLDISQNEFADLSDIASLTALVSLDASHNKIADALGIKNSVSLKTLYLSNNLLEELPISDTPSSLEVIDVSSNKIADITGISAYTNLTRLDASWNKIADISPIGGMDKLFEADFGYNSITAFSPVLYKQTPSLKVLKLSGNAFTSDEILNIFANGYPEIWLEDTDLQNKIPDMTAYDDIYELYVNNSQLTQDDIASIFAKTDYTGLGLGGILTESTITSLKLQRDLIKLDVSGAEIESSLLPQLAKLNVLELDISNCGITGLDAAFALGTLKVIDASRNDITSISAETVKTAVSRGVDIDISGNPVAQDHVYYMYLDGMGVEAKELLYSDSNFTTQLSVSTSEIKANVGDTVNAAELLFAENIYTGQTLDLPSMEYIDI